MKCQENLRKVTPPGVDLAGAAAVVSRSPKSLRRRAFLVPGGLLRPLITSQPILLRRSLPALAFDLVLAILIAVVVGGFSTQL